LLQNTAIEALCAGAAGDGCAIRCSYKADDGFLYPLDKAFFYVHKPPMCINHSDIEYVEFQRQGGGVISSSVRTFDLLIKQRSNNTVRGLFSCCTYISAAISLLSSAAACARLTCSSSSAATTR
jgi:hypothetical protein